MDGSELVNAEGDVIAIENILREKCEDEVEVFNFKVEEYHTYYVGACGVLVHNAEYTPSLTPRTYKPSPKHNPNTGWGSPNPIPDIETGQKLLDTSFASSKNKQLYNIYKNKLIKFQPDSTEGWHAYEEENPAKEIPADVLRKMLKSEKITLTEYKKFLKNNWK